MPFGVAKKASTAVAISARVAIPFEVEPWPGDSQPDITTHSVTYVKGIIPHKIISLLT
jgi:hypothetical protein